MVGVNERGLRVGEDHPKARLTDSDVELMRHMHEVDGVGYRRLATMFEVAKTTVRRICNYQMRCQPVAGFKRVA
jgi:DNA invertase Pin-like site-specific DNA recombinase